MAGTDPLPEDEKEELREAFSLLDEDGDGKVNAKELGTLMRAVGLNPRHAEVEDMIEEFNPDGDGTADFSAFVSMVARIQSSTDPAAEIKEVFQSHDVDGTGLIDAGELRHLTDPGGDQPRSERMEEIIRKLEFEGNGKVDYSQFVDLMMASE